MTFEEYVAARYVALRRLAFMLCGDWVEAEDLVQVALVRCAPRWDRIRDEDPHAYVRKAVINGARSWRRRRPPAPQPPTEAAGPREDTDQRVALIAALRSLPLPQREVLVLRYFEGLSEREIAAVLGTAAGTVKSRATRGLAALRNSGLLQDVDA